MTKNTHVRDDRDVYFQYLNDISKYPLLTKEQEKVVLAKVREGSREAMDLLVKSNLLDINRCINISVMVFTTNGTNPFPIRQLQVFVDAATFMT